MSESSKKMSFKEMMDRAVYVAALASNDTEKNQIENLLEVINERPENSEAVIYFLIFLMRQAERKLISPKKVADEIICVCKELNNDAKKLKEFLGMFKWSYEIIKGLKREDSVKVDAEKFKSGGFDHLKEMFLNPEKYFERTRANSGRIKK
ncbi:MAG: hypothetical protein QXW47_11250 [Candidatus Jordarchaeales archaeon]